MSIIIGMYTFKQFVSRRRYSKHESAHSNDLYANSTCVSYAYSGQLAEHDHYDDRATETGVKSGSVLLFSQAKAKCTVSESAAT